MGGSPVTDKDPVPNAVPAGPAVPAAPRVIPGFNKATPVPEKKLRSRSKKPKATPATDGAAAAPSSDAEGLPEPTLLVPVPAGETDLAEVEEKKTNAVEAVQKRLRSANKKIQRIVTYEEKTEALNQDQKNAVASKPTLEAIVKELQELLVILKAEEAEDDERMTRVKAFEEKRLAKQVEQAVAASKVEAESTLALLFQFMHLRSLYTPSGVSFAPPVLPSVVANATGQEVAAVQTLFEEFSNGPLTGGHDGAVEKLAKIAAGASDESLPGVSYARIKELIEGLTSEPLTATSLTPAGANDSTTALIDGVAEDEPTPSFLQESEILPPPTSVTPTPEEKVASWADDVDTPPPVVTAPEIVPAPAPTEVASGWGAPVAAVDWSEEHSGDLPSLPELTPPPPPPSAPAEPTPAPTATPVAVAEDADGFQAVGSARRGGAGDRGGRGGGRGNRGGSQFRGTKRGSWENRGEGRGGYSGEHRGEGRGGYSGEHRGEGRGGYGGEGRGGYGGEGRGEYRGRGRGRGGPRGGGERGGYQQRNGTPPANASTAPAAPAAEKW